MAKRKRRHYRGLVTIPGLGFLKPLTSGSAGVKDIAIGALAGLAGTMALRYVVNNFVLGRVPVPDVALKAFPLLGGLGTGIALYKLRKNKAAGKGNLVGATGAGAVVVGWDLLKQQFPALSDLVTVPPLQAWNGVIVDNPNRRLSSGEALQYSVDAAYGYGGVIVDNPNPGLAAVVASAQSYGDTDGWGDAA